MDEKSREYLDYRYHADLEDDFFYQVTVLENGVCGISEALGKKEPWNDTGDKPEDERVFLHRWNLETNIENKPEYEDCDRRLHESPDEIQIGAHVPRLDVAPRKVKDKCPALK
jgi:hypothetical protein